MSPTTVTASTSEVDPSRSKPTSAEKRIHWAETAVVAKKVEEVKPDPALVRKAALEQKFESMRARNWITERMVSQYQKHWNCTREAALERFLSKSGV